MKKRGREVPSHFWYIQRRVSASVRANHQENLHCAEGRRAWGAG